MDFNISHVTYGIFNSHQGQLIATGARNQEQNLK